MIIMSFRTKRDKEHLLKKTKEMEAYISELVDSLEGADHEDYEDDYRDDYAYSERGYRGNMSRGMRGGRYSYGR